MKEKKKPIEVYLLRFQEENKPATLTTLRYVRESALERALIGRVADVIIVRGSIESSDLAKTLELAIKPGDGIIVYDTYETHEVTRLDPAYRPGDQRVFWIRLGRPSKS